MAQVAHKDNFKQLVEGPVTVVDFWAPWCGPCKMMAPVMDQLEAEYGDRIKFVKFNIDEDQETATQFKVMSIPSLVLFRDGKAKEKGDGTVPKGPLGPLLGTET